MRLKISLQPHLKHIIGKSGAFTQLFLDTHELIVFSDPVAAGHGAGFNLAAVYAHRQIRNKGILGFSGPVGDNR
jgi:hypothetical protein